MQDDRISVYWTNKDKDQVANALGYATHAAAMKRHAMPYLKYTEDADIALTITPADQFEPVPGRFNILFTMWEFMDVPPGYIEGIKKADAIIVPSKFCRDIFRPYTNKPIEVCWEGVDPHLYRFHQRKFPVVSNGEKFRILWIGAPNPRKGYFTVLEFVEMAKNMPNVEVYMKTTAHKKMPFQNWAHLNMLRIRSMFDKSAKVPWNTNASLTLGAVRESIRRRFMPEVADMVQVFGPHKNIILDTRKLPIEDLVGLYDSAHLFVIPHCGEGWCLPLSEAMATGCPCIATDATGSKDFFDKDVGYPVKWDFAVAEMREYNLGKARVFTPDTHDFVRQIMNVIRDYDTALAKGKAGSRRIHSQFTWEMSGKRLGDIVRKLSTIKAGESHGN